MEFLNWNCQGTVSLAYDYKENNIMLEEFDRLLVCVSNELFINDEEQMDKKLSLVIASYGRNLWDSYKFSWIEVWNLMSYFFIFKLYVRLSLTCYQK